MLFTELHYELLENYYEELVFSHLLSQDVDVMSHLTGGNLHLLTLTVLLVGLLYHLHLHTHTQLNHI